MDSLLKGKLIEFLAGRPKKIYKGNFWVKGKKKG
jgi:hypothetical protein